MPGLGDIMAVLSLDVSGFAGGLADAQKGLFRFVHMAESVTSGIFSMGKAAISAGMEMGQAIDEAEISIANMAASTEEAAKFMQELRKFAVATPYAFDELTTEVRKLQGAGIELEDVIPILTIFGDKVSSIGGGAPELNRLVKAFTDMRTAGKVMSSDMRQFTELGIRAWDILAKSLGTSVQGAKEKVRKEFVGTKGFIEAVMKDMMATTGGQMNKMLTTLGGGWAAFKEGASLALADGLKPFREALVALLPVFAETAAAAGKFVSPVVAGLVYVTEVTTRLLDLFNHMPDWVQKGTFSLIALSAAAVVLAGVIAGAVFVLSAVGSSILVVGGVINMIGVPAIMLMASMMLTLALAVGNLITFGSVLALAWANDWNGIKSTVMGVLNVIGPAFIDFVKTSVSTLDEWAKASMKKINSVTQTLYDMAEAFSMLPNEMGLPSIFDVPQAALGKILDFQNGILDAVGDDSIIKALERLKSDLNVSLNSGLTGAVDDVRKSFQVLIDGPMKDLFLKLLPDDVRQAFDAWMSGNETAGAEGQKMLQEWLISFLAKWTEGGATGGKTKLTDWQKRMEKWMDDYTQRIFTDEMKDHSGARPTPEIFQDQMTKNVDRFNAAFSSAIDKSVEMWESAYQDAAEKAAKVGGTDILKDAIGNGSEHAGSVMSSVESSMKAFGPLLGAFAAVIGIIISLVTSMSNFQHAMDEIDRLFETIVGLFDKFTAPANALITAVVDLVSAILELAFNLGLGDALENAAGAMARVAAAIQPIIALFQNIANIFRGGASGMSVVMRIIDTAFAVLYYVFKGFALIIMGFVIAIGTVWNLILNSLANFADAIGLHKLADSLDGAKADIDGMTDQFNTMWDQSWEDAKALAMHTDVVEEDAAAVEAMTEALTNVPEGYKVALARFDAAAATGPGHPTGTGTTSGGGTSSGGGGGGGRNTPGPHGGLSNPDYNQYRTQGGSMSRRSLMIGDDRNMNNITARGQSSGGGGQPIIIQNLTVMAANLEDLQSQLEGIANRKAFVTRGAVSQNQAPRFVTR